MNWSKNTQTACKNLIRQLQLPDDFMHIVQTIYQPLTQLIVQQDKSAPLIVSINGAQGTGKSTLNLFLKLMIETQTQAKVATLSLDDFYTTRAQRQALARQVHPLFITRGVPGTHELELLETCLESLQNKQACSVPKFNKASDEREDKSSWTRYNKAVDIILFEGWCNNSPVQNRGELENPINELEQMEDPQGIWRDYANEQLKKYHQQIFSQTDLSIMLKAADFESIYSWRKLQENKLRQQTTAADNNKIMNDTELTRFIQHYERISRHTLQYLPAIADVVIPVNADHTMGRMMQRED